MFFLGLLVSDMYFSPARTDLEKNEKCIPMNDLML